MRTVIFDLDGTLADTSATSSGRRTRVFRGLGLGDLLGPATRDGAAGRPGDAPAGLPACRGLGRPATGAAVPGLLRRYEEAICDETALYPGCLEAVERLRAAGYRTGICTNKPERLARS